MKYRIKRPGNKITYKRARDLDILKAIKASSKKHYKMLSKLSGQ